MRAILHINLVAINKIDCSDRETKCLTFHVFFLTVKFLELWLTTRGSLNIVTRPDFFQFLLIYLFGYKTNFTIGLMFYFFCAQWCHEPPNKHDSRSEADHGSIQSQDSIISTEFYCSGHETRFTLNDVYKDRQESLGKMLRHKTLLSLSMSNVFEFISGYETNIAVY